MAACCPVTGKTASAFIIEKAKNFRDYIHSLQPDESIKEVISGFNESVVIPTVATIVVPIVRAGKTEEAVLDLMKKLTVPDDKKDEVKKKLCRYMEMFATVLTTEKQKSS
jgi:hypothetical protein